ncbi:MAG TPA: hypothetical protein VMF51_02960 [Nocardioides sp.]|uniref:hypothetical protein n=1 Tax=Nocardioides sp. TaxID=35761 RepID=UPI002C1E02BD|nr:hypothetical protein [Nocardioides sp.]HTW14059.1 hypothetical protein [Nocardioides sp.]
MPVHPKRVLVFLASLLLSLGLAAAVTPASPANAATSCSSLDQRYGKTQVQVKRAKVTKKRTATKVRKAKRVHAKRHTTVTKRKLVKARKADRRAGKKLRVVRTRNANAQRAAANCNASNAGTPTTPQQDAQIQQLLGQLAAAGLDPAQVQAVADQIAAALAGGGVSPATLLGVLEPVVNALTGADLASDQVAAALQQVLGTLTGDDVPSDSAGLVTAVIDALQDSLAGTPAGPLGTLLEDVQVTLANVLDALLGGVPAP